MKINEQNKGIEYIIKNTKQSIYDNHLVTLIILK